MTTPADPVQLASIDNRRRAQIFRALTAEQFELLGHDSQRRHVPAGSIRSK